MNEQDVEDLARWLHETALRLVPYTGHDQPNLSFEGVRPQTKKRYKAVARELLTNPPPCLSVLPIVVDAGKEP